MTYAPFATREPTLAERFDPRPGDERRLTNAIARRNAAWDRQREAAAPLTAWRAQGRPDLVQWVLDLNDANRELEYATRDLIRERVRWERDGVPW